MCGIAGVAHPEPDRPVDRSALEAMADRLVHRGPDARAVWLDDSVGLAHTRLSVIDLAGGAQPMRRRDDGPVIVYNGEIYNHHELRASLCDLGLRFTTASDTEVVLAAYEHYGRDLVDHLRGYAMDHPDRLELLLEHPVVRAYADEQGFTP